LVGAGAGIGVEFGLRGLPAGTRGTVPLAGRSSDAGFAALVGEIGVADSGGAEAPRASEFPPCVANINNTSAQDPAAFIAASNVAGHYQDEHHYENQPEHSAGRVTPAPAMGPRGDRTH